MSISPNPEIGGDIIGTVIYPPYDPCDNNNILKQSVSYDWHIYNKRGTEVYKNINSNITSLNIGTLNLKKGIYFIIVSNQSFVIKNKFIIR
ncbi:MAG: T9SS type A sorting domain-containing protein [Bacteroidales bacterium]|nr:T9SS type A sorting domain-containing protein [Bacteroidales bacterium]MBN2757618.1 T9SS type A sorting domain-containing protein [Bacteroidales bacterium]